MSGGLMYDDQFLQHIPTFGHPECPDRLTSIWRRLTQKGIVQSSERIPARPATRDELSRVHDRAYIESTLQRIEGRTGFLDGGDTYYSPGSRDAALLAAGGTIDLARAVWDGDLDWGFSLPRPPGHHAAPGRAMGFCIFGNLAAAAAELLEQGAERVMVFDWDVHHGNGTQDAFYDDPRVLFVSVHQWPHFPGTGLSDEIGASEGKGYTVNLPFPPGGVDGDYAAAMEQIVWPLKEAFAPEIILVSAGFDAYERDMLAGMNVSIDGFVHMAREVVQMAETTGRGPCLVLEGGYHLDGIAKAAEAVIRAIEGTLAPQMSSVKTPRCKEILELTREQLKPYWDCL